MQLSKPAPSQGAHLLTLAAVCLAALTMPLSFTGPALALTAIGRELGGSAQALTWVTNAFMLTFGGSLMAAGALADQYGRKRVFLLGVGLFSLSSLGLFLVGSLLWLDIWRAVQGLGAALSFASGLAALAQSFAGAARTRAFSLIGTTFGIGLAFGPLLCGLLIQALGWRAIFALAGLVGLLALGLAAYCMRESRDPQATGLDWPGALSFTLALSLLTYGALAAPERGWNSPLVIGLLLGSAAAFWLFVTLERRAARPMLDLSLFRYPRFVGVQCLAAAPAYAFVVLLVLLPLRLVAAEGVSEAEAGRVMLALSAPMLALPLCAAWLTRWFSAAALSAGGLLLCALGLWWLSRYPQLSALQQTLWPLLLIGVGISLPWGLMDGLAVSVVPKERAGMAAGIFSTTRVAGEGIALALVGALLAALLQQRLAAVSTVEPQTLAAAASQGALGKLSAAGELLPGLSPETLSLSYAAAFQRLLTVLSVLTVLSALVVALFLRGAGQAQPEETAAQPALDSACS
ncbi:MFS transporter [Chromobacterium haemolyticum]|uniref:MFS transporter n=1 Tax=Chromobacterium haemolyticum TaxID=394935 RepID=UPI0002F48581|nr:MFS transporter [Chromobacterium haemolyticum]MDH0340165.1 MFS transporter [Chromobacterium haemolyticum]PTU70296.1 MFS transporter [Chromobacterium haemolyticum]QOD84757.1 MFS transporter [Chromobacterium haemolyticum]